MPATVARIEAARRAGVDVSADTYAYPAWFNDLSAFIPPWAHDGGGAKLAERLKDPGMRTRIGREMETRSTAWDNEWKEVPGPEAILVGVVQNPELLPLQGKTVAQIAKLWGKDPIDTIFDLLIQDNTRTSVAVFGMSEPDVELALLQPWVSIDNDSQGTAPDGLLGREHPHPRAYGTFTRILRKYVREEKKLRLEEAIRKFSALAAQRMRLTDRGVLKAGMWADVVVFDADHIRDLATFENPNFRRDAIRAGERCACNRWRQGHERAAGQGSARSRVSIALSDFGSVATTALHAEAQGENPFRRFRRGGFPVCPDVRVDHLALQMARPTATASARVTIGPAPRQ